MTVPVWVECINGTYVASVLGTDHMRAAGPTKDAAVAALRTEIDVRVSVGELLFVDVEPQGLAGLAGAHKDDPDWQAGWDEIMKGVYRHRDELKAAEFPE